jgi:transcriptional regulator with XRE-family HTH domain
MDHARKAVSGRHKNPIDVHVGSRVRDRRSRLTMSQGELGELLGLSFQQIQKYEKGVNRIGAGLLPHIARILGVKIIYFYEGMEQGLPGAQPRDPEEDRARLVMEFVTGTEGAQLNHAFVKIGSAKVRKRLLDLMKCLAQEESIERDQG